VTPEGALGFYPEQVPGVHLIPLSPSAADKTEKMKIVINSSRRISAIQEEFSTMFPGLTLAFYAKPSHPGAAPSTKLIRHSGKTLQDCRINSNDGTIEILPTMNIAELKQNFRDVFGLSVEILKKTKDSSYGNTVGDNLILEEANKQYSGGS
jgi:hypothetical protein